MAQLDLGKIREEINRINDEMLALFIRRMELSADVHRYKVENGLPTTDRRREEAILQKVADKTSDEYRQYALQLFSTLISLSKEYQDSLK